MKNRTSINHRTAIKIMACNLLLAVVFCGCNSTTVDTTVRRKFTLSVHNGSGWSSGSSTIDCDSFQMIGTKKAEIWCDGQKMHIECNDVIYPLNR